MQDRGDFLVEIGTEELPPKALSKLAQSFAQGVIAGLAKLNLVHGDVRHFAAPRRLAVIVENLSATQADVPIERRGPALAAAFNEEGNPTPAAVGFARSCNVEIEQLETVHSEKGSWLVFKMLQLGKPVQELLPGIVEQALAALPIPKRMRWGELTAEFVRPVHWVVLLYGNDMIDGSVLGLRAGRHTQGHRFHHPRAIYIAEPAAYVPLLATEGHVLADMSVRREAIFGQVVEAAKSVGHQAVIDTDLLDEVTALVEWPMALIGRFDPQFLEVPHRALISTMKNNQKYFHVVDDQGVMQPYFITVSNIESKDPSTIIAGNQRVLRARLEDAKFFYQRDLEQPLDAHIAGLKTVIFHKKLGSVYDKTQRVARLALSIARALGASEHELALADRAALLSKCDLLTNMVNEFPELQGFIGSEYAQKAPNNEDASVAWALDEQYLPRFAGDQLAPSMLGQALAIADRLDTLVGIFSIGELPTGDKDPFGLRRAALGLLRTMIEQRLPLDLAVLIDDALSGLHVTTNAATIAKQVFDFMLERLRAYYVEAGIAPDVFEAVLARRPSQPYDFDSRLRAVASFRQLPEAASLAAAHKRIHNILRQAKVDASGPVDFALLAEGAEQNLAERVTSLVKIIQPLLEARDYQPALEKLAGLRDVVDAFFDQVMVMVDDRAIRDNRLRLLNSISELFLNVADLSHLQG